MVHRLRLKARYIKTVGITFKTNSITFKPDGITFETSNSIVSMKFSSEFWCSKPKLCESGHWHSCQIPEFRVWMKFFLSFFENTDEVSNSMWRVVSSAGMKNDWSCQKHRHCKWGWRFGVHDFNAHITKIRGGGHFFQCVHLSFSMKSFT